MKTIMAVLVVMFMFVPVVSQAQQCRLLQKADELQLTDDQIEKIRANSFSHQREMIQLKADLQRAKLEQRELMLANKIDKKGVLKKAEAISAIKAQMAQKKLAGRIDRLNMLTDKQRAKVRRNMMLRGGKDKGPGHGMGQGMGGCDFSGMGHGKGMFHDRGPGGRRNIEVIIEKEIIDDKN